MSKKSSEGSKIEQDRAQDRGTEGERARGVVGEQESKRWKEARRGKQ